MAKPPLLRAEMAVSSKFSAFNLIDTTYKTVNDIPIPATILVKKNIQPGPCPVHVRFHGGCLIAGHRMYPDWFGEWILQLASTHNAIIISPDYRLMPEANGMDILHDLQAFYSWLLKVGNLKSLLPEGLEPDLDHLLVTGESAGGWLTIQSTIMAGVKDKIAAAIAHYPMIDLRDGHYTADYEKHIFTPPAPQLDRSILSDYLSKMDKSATITSATPPDRFPLVLTILQQGRYDEFFGHEKALYPLEALERVDSLPPTWVLHGTADTMVPVEGTKKWEVAVREKVPKAEVRVHYEEGGEHGFDNEGTTLETQWVRDGVEFVRKFWPRC